MKLIRSLTLGLTLLVSLTLLEAPQAQAGNIILRAAGAEDPATGAAARVNNTGTNHKYVTVDFADGSEVCTLFHFGFFSDYVANANILGSFWVTTSGTDADTPQMRFDLSCVTPGSENYNTTSLTNGTPIAFLPTGTAGVPVQTNILTATLNETTAGCGPDTPAVLRVCRTTAGGANPDTVKLIQIRLEY